LEASGISGYQNRFNELVISPCLLGANYSQRKSTPAVTAKSRRGWIVTEGNTSTMLIGALIWASVK
jgi:hypothetical protein